MSGSRPAGGPGPVTREEGLQGPPPGSAGTLSPGLPWPRPALTPPRPFLSGLQSEPLMREGEGGRGKKDWSSLLAAQGNHRSSSKTRPLPGPLPPHKLCFNWSGLQPGPEGI